ncbi:MAG: ompA [Chitinophagaceae bacterium]|nr:ompA [Chitinophagaceae bacterium]
MKKLLFILFFCSYAALVMGQKKEIKEALGKAETHFVSDEYGLALPYYLEVDKLSNPKRPDISYKIGLCYLDINQPGKSTAFFLHAKAGGIKDEKMDFYIGQAYHSNHNFDKAIESFETYRATLKKNNEEELYNVDTYINYCKVGKELVKNPIKVKISNLGPNINSPYPDYVPAISADETVLIFTSRRPNTTGGGKDLQDDYYYEDIYISVKADDTTWTSAVQLGSEINTPSHDACVGLSPDGQELFVYKVTGKDGGDLYQSNLVGTVWSTPKSLGSNINSSYWEPSATTNSDENVIIFSSTRKGGFGGRDLYLSRKLPNGEFGPAVNMGPKINTVHDEDGPFIHADGKTLYFSSKGHKSMGGFDIFSCELDLVKGEIKTAPANVGYPINTADDDIFFVWSADNKRAYFSSAREGGYGEKDLYMLERDEAKAALVVFKGAVYNCDSDKPVTALIKVTDLATGKLVGVYNTNSSSGKYTVILPPGKNYGLAVEAPGYLFYSKNIDVPTLDHYIEVKDSICLDKIKVGTKIVLRNVFFDVNKATLRPESVTELDRLVSIMTENPHLKIEVSGHTDSDGNDELNLKLSQARAKAVLDYVVKKGVLADRMTSKGYGETQPMAPNDTPENKQMNRRTEIKVLED